VSRYTVYVIPRAWREIKDLPGHVRQRVKRAIEALKDDPRLPVSKRLDTRELDAELYRLRLDRWRVVYAVTEADKTVDVIAVRKRPPYDYGDLGHLLEEASDS
jgi:mRNA interferase RelE/StbE